MTCSERDELAQRLQLELELILRSDELYADEPLFADLQRKARDVRRAEIFQEMNRLRTACTEEMAECLQRGECRLKAFFGWAEQKTKSWFAGTDDSRV